MNAVRTQAQVEAWLAKEGYGLEHATATEFAKRRYATRIGRPYRDPTTGKIRDVDVTARSGVRSSVPIVVAIECKSRSTGAWVFRKATFRKSDRQWRPIGSQPEVDELARMSWPLDDVYQMSQPVAYAVREAAGDDGAYAALNQAIDGALSVVADYEAVVVLPAVVIDTPLFAVSYDPGSSGDVSPTEHEIVLWSQSPRLEAPVAIPVVHASWLAKLPEYLTDVELEIAQVLDGWERPAAPRPRIY